jgi:IS5 family transposase
MLALQALNNLSSEDLDYPVRDRLSFTGCMGLGIEYSIPDVSTV